MVRAISAADANRKFSEVLRSVREGDSFVVTSHDRPIARIVPVSRAEGLSVKARSALLKRLRSQRAISIGRWRRDDLYDDAR